MLQTGTKMEVLLSVNQQIVRSLCVFMGCHSISLEMERDRLGWLGYIERMLETERLNVKYNKKTDLVWTCQESYD